jgi:hypothetical protein
MLRRGLLLAQFQYSTIPSFQSFHSLCLCASHLYLVVTAPPAAERQSPTHLEEFSVEE